MLSSQFVLQTDVALTLLPRSSLFIPGSQVHPARCQVLHWTFYLLMELITTKIDFFKCTNMDKSMDNR